MKKTCYFLFLFVLAWGLAHTSLRSWASLQCNQAFKNDTSSSEKEIKEKIMELITENPYLTQFQLALKTGVDISTVKETFNILKKEEGIVRIRTKGGYWKKLKEGEKPPHYDSPEERVEKILSLIAESPYITTVQIAEKLGYSRAIVFQVISRLAKKKRLKRYGTKGGYWEIL